MKHSIKYRCGHTKTENLSGSLESQQIQRVLLEDVGLCPDCYKAYKHMIFDDPSYGVLEMFLTDYQAEDHHDPILKASFAYRHGSRKQFRDPVVIVKAKGDNK